MQTKGTWEDLEAIRDSVTNDIDTKPAIKLFFENQRRHFADRNADTFAAIVAAKHDLMLEYFVTDEGGEFVLDEFGNPVLIEGMEQEDYEADYAALMQTETIIYS
jgi:hypothetical protein